MKWTTATFGLAIGPILWGTAFPAIKLALESFDPYQTAAARLALAALGAVSVAIVFRVKPPRARDWAWFVGGGLVGYALYYTLAALTMTSVPAGTAGVVMALVPLTTSLLAAGLLRERVRNQTWTGMSLALVGVAVLTAGSGKALGWTRGSLFLVAAVLAASFFFIMERIMLRSYTSLQVLLYTLILGSLPALLPVTILVDWPSSATWAAVGAVAYLAIFPTLAAYGAMTWSLSRTPTADVMAFVFLAPVSSLATAALFLGEWPSLLAWLGSGICIVAVWIATRTAGGQGAETFVDPMKANICFEEADVDGPGSR